MATIQQNKIIQYFVHTFYINGSEVNGVQTATMSKNFDTTTLVAKGLPTSVTQFYKKPTVSITVSKFLPSGATASILSGFSLPDILYTVPPTTYELDIKVVGASGLYFKDAVLSSLSYRYNTQGFFTEDITYTGHVTATSTSVADRVENTGIIYRRQDFSKGTLPLNMPDDSVLLSVEASANINYGEIPTYGRFSTASNKYITYPVDITCSYEVLDLGYKQERLEYLPAYNHINDQISYETIIIGGPPQINLGSENFLTSVERNGGDAGNNSYATLRYNYKNNNNQFILS